MMAGTQSDQAGIGGSVDTDVAVPAPRVSPETTFRHQPWCLHVADGTADQLDDADDAMPGDILHHPDGDDICPGAVGTVDDGVSAAVGTWLVGEGGIGGGVELLVSGTARYRTRADVEALVRELAERMELMPA
jgi:hypothetical protein